MSYRSDKARGVPPPASRVYSSFRGGGGAGRSLCQTTGGGGASLIVQEASSDRLCLALSGGSIIPNTDGNQGRIYVVTAPPGFGKDMVAMHIHALLTRKGRSVVTVANEMVTASTDNTITNVYAGRMVADRYRSVLNPDGTNQCVPPVRPPDTITGISMYGVDVVFSLGALSSLVGSALDKYGAQFIRLSAPNVEKAYSTTISKMNRTDHPTLANKNPSKPLIDCFLRWNSAYIDQIDIPVFTEEGTRVAIKDIIVNVCSRVGLSYEGYVIEEAQYSPPDLAKTYADVLVDATRAGTYPSKQVDRRPSERKVRPRGDVPLGPFDQ
jgi:hypothetical protein